MAPGSSRSLAQTSRASPYGCSASSSFSFLAELTRVVCQLSLRSRRPRSSWNFDFGMDTPSPPPPHRVPSARPLRPSPRPQTLTHTPTDTHTPLPQQHFLLQEGRGSSIFKHTCLLLPQKGHLWPSQKEEGTGNERKGGQGKRL